VNRRAGAISHDAPEYSSTADSFLFSQFNQVLVERFGANLIGGAGFYLEPAVFGIQCHFFFVLAY
jgi:hypothetical protein